MTEKGAEEFIPGVDELDVTKSLINFNINDAYIAAAAEDCKDIDAYKDLEGAKKAKKLLVAMRGTLSDAHKEQKSDALRYGQKLDAEKRRLLALIEPIEQPLTDQLDAIRNAAALKERERTADIQLRIDEIRSHGYNLDSLDMVNLKIRQESLAAIEVDDRYDEFRDQAGGAKAEAEGRIRLATSKRKAQDEMEARLETQRKEQEEQQKKLDEQQADIDRQNKEADDRRRVIQEEADAKARIELEDRDRELKQEQERLDKQKAEQDHKAFEEGQRKKAELRQAARLIAAPDVEKLEHYSNQINALTCDIPQMETDPAQAIANDTHRQLLNVRNQLISRIEELK